LIFERKREREREKERKKEKETMVNKVKGEMMMKEAPEDPNATQVKGTAGCLDQSNINMAESIRMVVAVIGTLFIP
jgi:hypothetical protein